ncbi:MAG TPA: HDIG domain-containing protein [Acidimicrobiia bacterium]|nr:HDIG domain-containing protein [Acidimicrobiia bacterium]
MRIASRISALTKIAILATTLVLTSLALIIGRDTGPEPVSLSVGEPAPQTFIASGPVEVVDVNETERQRADAAAAVDDVYRTDTQATETVLAGIAEFFSNLSDAAQPVVIVVDDPDSITPPPTEATTTTEETTTTVAPESSETTDGETTTTSSTTTTTLPPEPPSLEDQIARLKVLHPLLRDTTIEAMVAMVNSDRDLPANEQLFSYLQTAALDTAQQFLLDGIRSTELESVRSRLVTQPRPLVLVPVEIRPAAEAAVADLLSVTLQANEFKDENATQVARLEAEAAVADQTKSYLAGEKIVGAGERVDAVALQAIQELGLLDFGDPVTPVRALTLIAALVVLLAMVFVARVTEDFWRQPKMVGLFGMLIVLAAIASRVPALVARDQVELGFLLPAALFGYLAANLFDARIAVLMAVPVAAFTALSTGDLALVVFAGMATLAPIPLVSSVASRAQLNLAVVFSAVIQVPSVAALAWFFYGQDTIVLSMVWGFVSGIITGVVALGIMPILSTAFGITTTQTLLDLTDRNHPALRRVEEMAPGTFNHSVLVGNIADRAARAVGANPLLARAMAYYHDLGKTVQPKYFVENQFGVTNPHDRLPPEESASIIRSHVAEGLRLAREYRIPPDVAQGILTHHGTSLMRFFLHKAEETYGDRFDPADYRHRGRKPKTKEMVIVMLGDATEAGTRALVQHEDPTSESIRKLVEGIIAEKVEDGQLEESDVTFGELTRIKEAFVDAMIGYYHTRIPYPGFPGVGGVQPT